MNEQINLAKYAIEKGDATLIESMRTQIENEMCTNGYVLLRERRIVVKNNPRRQGRTDEAREWERDNRKAYLSEILSGAAMLDEIDEWMDGYYMPSIGAEQ